MLFRIKYALPTGELSTMDVEADTPADAVTASRILQKRVLSVDKANILEGVFNSAPALPDQISFLAALASAVTAGHGADKEFLDLVRTDKTFKAKLGKVEAKILTSERLRVLNFEATAVMLSEMGERSKTLGKSLSIAAEMLTENDQIERQMSKGVMPQIIMIFVLLAAMCGIPYVFGPIIDELTKPGIGIRVNKNILTEFTLFIRTFLNATWYLLIVGFAAILIFRNQIWKRAKTFGFFANLNELNKAKRGIQFISAFITLDAAGVPALEFLTRIQAGIKKSERPIYTNMIDMLNGGKPLSETFDPEWFPKMLCRAVTGMEKAEREDRKEMLLLLRRNLMTRTSALSDKITIQFKLLGWLVLLLVAMNMLVGLYLPLMTIESF